MSSSSLKTLHSSTIDEIFLEGITCDVSLAILKNGFADILVLCNGCRHIMSFKKLLFRDSLDWKYVAILIKASCISFWYYFQESWLHFFNNAFTSTPTFVDLRGNQLPSSLTSISSSAFSTLQFTTSALRNFSISEKSILWSQWKSMWRNGPVNMGAISIKKTSEAIA